MTDFNARHIIEALRSGIPSRAVGAYFSEARPAMLRRLNDRMEAVRQWFIAHGVAPERIEKAYYHGVDYHARTARVARRAEIKFAR